MINLEGTNQCREFNILRDNMTIYELRNELSKIYKIPLNQMELLLNDLPLKNHQILSEVGIGNNLLTLRKINLSNLTSNPNQTPDLSSSYLLNNGQQRQTPNQNLNNSSQLLLHSNYNNQVDISNSQLTKQPQTQNISNININPQYSNMNINPNNGSSTNQALANSFMINPDYLGLSQSAILNDAIAYNNLFGSNPNTQRRIESIIHNQRINDNLRTAAEYNPESLFPVHMLYINVEINKHKTAALIDTGAQSSFMSENLCKTCGLINLMDKRFQGIARGVGASKILGVIHSAEIKIMDKIILARINIIENNDVGFVLGLDNLRKHNCNVDLKKNGLVFPDIGIIAKFLSDGEIEKMKLERQQEEENEEIERAKIESLNYI